ncbi:hypothetical protein ACFT4A_02325 [Streptomyces sp. NPDC057099]|uniref:hypothetical protein n=1 Tax=Streptomyces sp. NPDC057099 TaxID=3346019 RepID=UPI00363E43EC
MPAPGERYDTPVIAELDLYPGESVHITFSGDTPPMCADVLHDLVDRAAASDPAPRETFPWRFGDSPDTVAAQAKDRLVALCAFLSTVDTDRLAADIIDRDAKLPAPAPRGRLWTRASLTPHIREAGFEVAEGLPVVPRDDALGRVDAETHLSRAVSARV